MAFIQGYNPAPNYAVNPPANANGGIINMGGGPFNGIDVGHFAGNALGTALAVNLASGSTADYLRFQSVGADRFLLANNGDMTVSGTINAGGTANMNVLQPIYKPSPLQFRASDSQGTVDIVQVQTNAGTALAGYTVSGESWSAGIATGVAAYAAAHTLTSAESISEDTATAAYTVTLPAASTAKPGRRYTVIKVDSSANAVTVAPTGADTIHGGTLALSTQYASLTVVRNAAGTGWWGGNV